MDNFTHDADDLLKSLGELRPLAPKLNRDRMLFEAGRASKPKSRVGKILPAVTIALALGLIQRESQVVWERGQRQRLEATIAALEHPAKPTPTAVEPERIVMTIARELPPSSYAALSLRLRSGDSDDAWMDMASNPPVLQPRIKTTEPQSSPLRAIDSRRPISL